MARNSSKHPRESHISTMKIVAPEHLNAHGTLFGGYLMCWVDEIAYMAARKYSGTGKCVTAHIDSIAFKSASDVGHHVLLEARVIFVGQSSMDVLVKVRSESTPEAKPKDTLEAVLTFVALGADGLPRPVPRLVPETSEDRRLHYQAQLRRKVRSRFNRYLERATQAPLSKSVREKRHQNRIVRFAEKSGERLLKQFDQLVPWI